MKLFIDQLEKMMRRLEARFPHLAARLPGFARLLRLDKPIGTFLLLWPTLGALWIASEGFPSWKLLIIFLLGTWLMRSAGCAINDFADSGFDGKVLRTQGRPIVTGEVTRKEALMTFAVLSLCGFFLLLFTNGLTIQMSFLAVGVAALYPFMKRFTHLPQLVLGIAFSFGILMAFTAARAELPASAWLLFVANCLWTVAYDTQYAMVDREYDVTIGVKSTAILFGDADRIIIAGLQGMSLFAWGLAGRQFGLGVVYWLGLAVAAALFFHQWKLTSARSPEGCFRAFLNNHRVGAAVFTGIFAHYLLS